MNGIQPHMKIDNLWTEQMLFDMSGSENEIPIVLVPGGLSGWISWKPHAEILSKDFKVVRVQLLNREAAEKKQSPGIDYSLRKESNALKIF